MSERPFDAATLDALATIASLLGVALDPAGLRQEAEARLRAEQRFDLLARATKEGVWDWDIGANRTWWNENARVLFGWAPEELAVDGAWAERLHADDRERVVSEMWRAIERGESVWSDQYQFRRRDGSYALVVDRGFVVRDAGGRAVRMLGSITDVTAQAEAQERLRESEERFRLAMHATDDVIHDWDFESGRGSWTGAGLSLFGYPADTAVSPEWWLECVHPEDRERVRRAKQEFLAGSDRAWSQEYRLRRADGGYADVLDRCFLVRFPDRRPRRLVGSIMDVTERRHAREGLARQLARVHALFDLTATASRGAPPAEIHQRALDALLRGIGADRASILLFDEGGVMRFVAWHGISETYRRAVEGHSPWTRDASAPEPIVIVDVVGSTSLGPLRATVLEEGIRALAFIPVYHERLLGKFMLYFDAPRALAADELEYALTVARHVAFATQRQQAEAELRGSQAELRALAARLQDVRENERARIAREIHDELGQALTALKLDIAAGQKLVEQTRLGSARREACERMRDRLEDMARIVDGTVKSVRRIATELRPAVLDDLGLVPALEWQAQEFQQRTGVRCALESRLRGTRVRREVATALFRVFQETLTNVVRHAGARRVEVRLAREEAAIVLEVRDDGRGVSRTALRSARGLGLAGMRERAASVGGELSVEGKRGGGTTVRVRVPLRRPAGRERRS